MSNQVSFGIAIPTKNRAETLQRTIQGTLDEMPDNASLHVLDNGSDDNTAKVIAGFTHSRFHGYYDSAGTHVQHSFMRVLEEAALGNDYVILVSDEDEVLWEGFEQLTNLLTTDSAGFVSTTFAHPPHFTRSNQNGTITPSNWFASAFYCSGLVFNSADLLKVVDAVRGRIYDSTFVGIYAQSFLALAMIPHNRHLWSNIELCRIREKLDTLFSMEDGSAYWEPENRRKILADYLDDVNYLGQMFPEHALVWEQAKLDNVLNSWR
jgi:glycosyltransferase involved in cell wall biosynthesis